MKMKRIALTLAASCLLASCGETSSSSLTSSAISSSSSSSVSSSSSYTNNMQTLANALASFSRDNLGFLIKNPTLQAKLTKNEAEVDTKDIYSVKFDEGKLLATDIKDDAKRKVYFGLENTQVTKKTITGETVGDETPIFVDEDDKADPQSVSLYFDQTATYYDLSKASYIYDLVALGGAFIGVDVPEKGYYPTGDSVTEALNALGVLPIPVNQSSDVVVSGLTTLQNDESSNVTVAFENRNDDFYLNISTSEATGVKSILTDLVNAAFDAYGEDSYTTNFDSEDIEDVTINRQEILDWIKEVTSDIVIHSFNVGLGYGLYDIKYLDFNLDIDFVEGQELKDTFVSDYSLSELITTFRVNILADDEVQIPTLDLTTYEEIEFNE